MKSDLPPVHVRKTKRVVSIGWLPNRSRAHITQLAGTAADDLKSAMRHAPDVVCIGRGLNASAVEKRELIKAIAKVGVAVIVQAAR